MIVDGGRDSEEEEDETFMVEETAVPQEPEQVRAFSSCPFSVESFNLYKGDQILFTCLIFINLGMSLLEKKCVTTCTCAL